MSIRTLAILHLADTSGPSKTLRPGLERLAGRGELEVVVPGEGRAGGAYADIATVTTFGYQPLTFAHEPVELARTAHAFRCDVARFRGHLRHRRPDLMVIATGTLPAALVAARLEGIPAIVEVDEIFDKGFLRGRGRAVAARAIIALTVRLADAIVCCSEAVARQFDGAATPVTTIYPGIGQEHAGGDGDALRERHALPPGRPLIAVVGNISAGRGQDIVIRALPAIRDRLPGANCLLVGLPHPRPVDREFESGLATLAADLGVSDGIAFPGFVEQVADVYAAADVLVNPARFNEPFGRMALEALLAGCPVVATTVGAIPEVLRTGRDALLVPPDDPDALAEAVVRVAEDTALAERLVNDGRERVAHEFTEERAAEAFERVADAVLARSTAGRPDTVGASAAGVAPG